MVLRNKFFTQILITFPVLQQIFRFGIVGLCAAGVHFSIVVLLVQAGSLLPLGANVVAFLCAFQVSYWGNRLWTFSETASLHRVTFPKLFLVQVLNLLANESLFLFFLTLDLPYPIALLLVLFILPIFTFTSSKWWVFN